MAVPYRVRAHTTQPTSIRLPADVKARLQQESVKQNVTVSWIIVEVLRGWMKAQQETEAAE